MLRSHFVFNKLLPIHSLIYQTVAFYIEGKQPIE